MAGGWPASKKGIPGYSEGICWLLVYIYIPHVYMIPARRKQLSLNFTTLLILSLFPYRTWDLHGIQPRPYSHDREYCLCLKTTTTTYRTYITNTNQHQPTTSTTTPLANMFTLTTLLAASGFLLSTSHALEFPDSSCAICPPDNQTLTACGQYVFFSPSSLSSLHPPPTNTSFFSSYLDVSAAATISAPNLAKNSPCPNATASRTKS